MEGLMPDVNEVEVKVDSDYVYIYCDNCITTIPEFMVDTKRVVKVTEPTKCDGCGGMITDATS